MEYRKAMLMGRLNCELQKDHGWLVHLVEIKHSVQDPKQYFIGNKSLCGRKPGRRSVGWALEFKFEVSCERCLKKMKRMENEQKTTS